MFSEYTVAEVFQTFWAAMARGEFITVVGSRPSSCAARPLYAAAPHGAPAASASWKRTTTPSKHAAATPTFIPGIRLSWQTEELRVTRLFTSAWDSTPLSQIGFRQRENSPGSRSAYGQRFSSGASDHRFPIGGVGARLR